MKDAGSELVGNVLSNVVESKIPIKNEALKSIIGEVVGVGTESAIAGSEEWFRQHTGEIDELTKQYIAAGVINEKKARWMATKKLLEKSIH